MSSNTAGSDSLLGRFRNVGEVFADQAAGVVVAISVGKLDRHQNQHLLYRPLTIKKYEEG